MSVSQFLYERIVHGGTINERGGKPEPQFALPATVNWIHALKLVAQAHNLTFLTASARYEGVAKRTMPEFEQNTIFEQLLLSLHHLSALNELRQVGRASDVGRVGILIWYYGLSNAATAMVAAQSGDFKEDHTGTARLWDEQISKPRFAMPPFDLRVSTLVEKKYKSEIEGYRAGRPTSLQSKPNDFDSSVDVLAGYLSGTAKWYAWSSTERVRSTSDFKDLGVNDFRSKRARDLRDASLEKKAVCFLHQAVRYRGKANYRDALFLAYGASANTIMADFADDLQFTLKSFLAMAGAFCRMKLGRDLWDIFVADVEKHRAFTLGPKEVW